MRRDTKIQALAAAVLVICMALSVSFSIQLTSIAGRSEITYTDRAEDNDRWEVSAGIAMGAFRGIFVNLLWIRANDQKEAGKFYEAVELAQAITRLQPRFPRVWVFHAWNLAYNISVMTQTREERWNWVNQGIQLLRDKAIPANPNDLLLHKELGWIFLHKVQGVTDDANPYYKQRLAAEWTFNLGQPPLRGPEDKDRAKVKKKYADWLRTIANAPQTLDALYAQEPSARTLVERLTTKDGIDLDTKAGRRALLQRVEVVRANLRSVRSGSFRSAVEQGAGDRAEVLEFIHALDDPQYAKAWDALLLHVRRRTLVEDYNMEPDRMVRYTEKYGPIDWRHGAAHSLYWTARGVEESLDRVRRKVVSASDPYVTLDKGNVQDFDFLNTDRVVAQSVQELFRSGDLYFDFTSFVNGQYSMWQGSPNPAFAETYGEIMDDMRSRSEIDAQRGKRWVSPLSAGYENFMIDVALYFYRRGERAETQKWLNRLRNYKDMNTYDPERDARFTDMDQFAMKEMETNATTAYKALAAIDASLMGAFTSGLLSRDPDLFTTQYKYAQDFHKYFFEKQARTTSVNLEKVRMEIMDTDFEWVVGPRFAAFITSLGLDDATYVYAAAPRNLQYWAYDALSETHKQLLDEEAKKQGKTFAQVFPEPPGINSFRVQRDAKIAERSRQGAPDEVRGSGSNN